MRLAKRIYSPFLDGDTYLNVGNILFEYEGDLMDIELIPDSYLQEHYGFTKEELAATIAEELEYEQFQDLNYEALEEYDDD